MDVTLILKVAGIGLLVSLGCTVLGKAGREEQSTLLSIMGILLVFFLLIEELGDLIAALRGIFGL